MPQQLSGSAYLSPQQLATSYQRGRDSRDSPINDVRHVFEIVAIESSAVVWIRRSRYAQLSPLVLKVHACNEGLPERELFEYSLSDGVAAVYLCPTRP